MLENSLRSHTSIQFHESLPFLKKYLVSITLDSMGFTLRQGMHAFRVVVGVLCTVLTYVRLN